MAMPSGAIAKNGFRIPPFEAHDSKAFKLKKYISAKDPDGLLLIHGKVFSAFIICGLKSQVITVSTVNKYTVYQSEFVFF